VIAAFFYASMARIDWLLSSIPIPPKPNPSELSSSAALLLKPIANLAVLIASL
jgi:hypothetical protein